MGKAFENIPKNTVEQISDLVRSIVNYLSLITI